MPYSYDFLAPVRSARNGVVLALHDFPRQPVPDRRAMMSASLSLLAISWKNPDLAKRCRAAIDEIHTRPPWAWTEERLNVLIDVFDRALGF